MGRQTTILVGLTPYGQFRVICLWTVGRSQEKSACSEAAQTLGEHTKFHTERLQVAIEPATFLLCGDGPELVYHNHIMSQCAKSTVSKFATRYIEQKFAGLLCKSAQMLCHIFSVFYFHTRVSILTQRKNVCEVFVAREAQR